MNNILRLTGQLTHRKNGSQFGFPSIPKGAKVTKEKIEKLIIDMRKVISFWQSNKTSINPLISVFYIKIAAKSNRAKHLLSQPGKPSNSSIVGVRFSEDEDPKHIITHCVPMDCLESTLKSLEICFGILDSLLDGYIKSEELKKDGVKCNKVQASEIISKNKFAETIKDIYYIDHFDTTAYTAPRSIKESQIVTLYDTGADSETIYQLTGLSNAELTQIDNLSWLVTPEQYEKLYANASYLIAMQVKDLNEMPVLSADTTSIENSQFSIPEPKSEPVIGVIDTLFDKNAYFKDWVDYTCMLDKDIPFCDEDLRHGTEVDSIIVDGPGLNPGLDDHCGRFRVRHFGIATAAPTSVTTLISRIRQIIASNKDIKVWNLSLGAPAEVDKNSISPVAAILDEIQYNNDVIFVVAGTNNECRNKSFPRIGSPADSINSLVVNSISFEGKPEGYSRKGPVLSFFSKPDVSAYGGNKKSNPIYVYSTKGRIPTGGTSFAAPWVARKLAYLIYYLQLPKELAKALIIDCAADWNSTFVNQDLVGFGKVPVDINSIIRTPNDEIKFMILGTTLLYETYAYNIPVPISKGKFPFIAKATLCYFPRCSRNQGVDYTDSELDIHFGRINKTGKIKSINNNSQGDSDSYMLEKDARTHYRKWDNVKHISEELKGSNREKITYRNSNDEIIRNWGISIKAKERLEAQSGQDLRFGLVITLKEVNKVNRIQEFIQQCIGNQWFIDEVIPEVLIRNYNALEQEIVFDD